VILASDSSQVAGPSNPSPSGIRYGGMNPGTARPESAPLPPAEHSPKNRIDGTRYDGDWGVASAPPPSAGSATEMKDEASTAAAIGHPGSETEFRGSKASADGTSRFARPGSETEFRGSKASEDGTSRFARPGSETEFRGSKASEDGTSRFARPGSETDLPGPASALP
jgi:hypothetical protein